MRIVSKFISLFLLVLVLFSCKKESPTYSFTVRVINEEGVALPNMFVEATADVPNTLADFSGKTDENGEISFSYDYEAVLKVRATRGSNPPSWMGCNFVKLEPNSTVNVNVVVQPYDPSQPGC
jgi:hypothetical protein